MANLPVMNCHSNMIYYLWGSLVSCLLIVCIIFIFAAHPGITARSVTDQTESIVIILSTTGVLGINSFTLSFLYDTTRLTLVSASTISPVPCHDFNLFTDPGNIAILYDANESSFILPNYKFFELRFAADEGIDLSSPGLFSYTSSGTSMYSENSIDNFISHTTTRMGDINADGVINSTDALLTLRIATGALTPTPAQQIAADINRDGTINTTDSLLVNRYAIEQITCLWNAPVMPEITGEAEGIISGMAYRVKNSYTGWSLGASAADGQPIEQYITGSKFIFEYLSAEDNYRLKFYANQNLVAALSTDKKLTLQTDSGLSRQRWKIKKTGTAYYIINQAYLSEGLSASWSDQVPLSSSAAKFGYLWKIPHPVIHINNYYDYAYDVRYPSSPAAYISARQAELNTAISTIFGVDVVSDITPQRIVSYADKCRLDYGQQVTTTSINQFCTHAENSSCENSTFPNHHTCSCNILDYFINSYGSDTARPIVTLTTGQSVCDYKNGVHGRFASGLACRHRTLVSCCEQDDNPPDLPRCTLSLVVMLHEQSHALGAVAGVTDTNHGLYCVMSYNALRDEISRRIQRHDNNIYCASCKQSIINYINNNF